MAVTHIIPLWQRASSNIFLWKRGSHHSSLWQRENSYTPHLEKGGQGGFSEQMLSYDKQLKALSQHLTYPLVYFCQVLFYVFLIRIEYGGLK